MKNPRSNLRICTNGHRYHKTSDCPVCPICEQVRKPTQGFLSQLSAPARRALENNNINTLQKLSAYAETDILKLHGIGKTSIPILQAALQSEGLHFKNIEPANTRPPAIPANGG